jgi:hypothetical protein
MGFSTHHLTDVLDVQVHLSDSDSEDMALWFLHEKEKGCEQGQINIPSLFSQVKIHFLYVFISKRPLSQVKN